MRPRATRFMQSAATVVRFYSLRSARSFTRKYFLFEQAKNFIGRRNFSKNLALSTGSLLFAVR